MSDYIPHEIAENILLRLPARSLIKCTLVCKSWRSMIKSPKFNRDHLSRNVDFSDRSGTQLLLLHSVSGRDYYPFRHIAYTMSCPIQELYSLHYDNHAFDEYYKIEFPIPHKEIMCSQNFHVTGICNGLVFLEDGLSIDYYSNFIIWNPCIRKSLILPNPALFGCEPSDWLKSSVGFGYDAITNDYKVVRLAFFWEDPDEPTVADVYSLATGSWKTLGCVPPPCRLHGREPSVFVNGALHWAVLHWEDYGSRCFILKFDVGSELFHEVPMPSNFKQDISAVSQLSLSGDGKSIALFSKYYNFIGHPDYYLDVWVMKEYGVEESWTKLITLDPQGRQGSLRCDPHHALCFRKSGELVVVLVDAAVGKYELVSLDLVSRQIKTLGIHDPQHFYVHSYQETLVLLDKTGTISY